MAKKLTFKDIAKLANVGLATVSRYFNNYNISDEAKAKIKKVVEENNFVPNYSAAILKKGSKDVYLIMPYNVDESSTLTIAQGVKDYLDANYNFLIYLSSNDTDKYLADLKEIVYRNPLGVILLLPNNESQELNQYIESLKNIPIVVYNKKFSSSIKRVSLNDRQMYYELTTRIMADYQNEKIAFIGLEKKDITTGQERYEGFLKAIESQPHSLFEAILLKANNNKLAVEAATTLSKNGYQIIICATDTIAKAVYQHMNESKIDYLVITDIGYQSPKTLTIRNGYKIFIDYFLIGQQLARSLFAEYNQLENPEKIVKYRIIKT